MSQKDPPTAVLTYGHETAIPIMLAAERLGLKLGADFGMITFGDEPLWITSLACTTMTLRNEDMGRQAVAMLAEKITNPQRRLLPQRVGYRLFTAQTTSTRFGWDL